MVAHFFFYVRVPILYGTNKKKIRILSKSTNFAECIECKIIYILLPFNFLFVLKPSNLK